MEQIIITKNGSRYRIASVKDDEKIKNIWDSETTLLSGLVMALLDKLHPAKELTANRRCALLQQLSMAGDELK